MSEVQYEDYIFQYIQMIQFNELIKKLIHTFADTRHLVNQIRMIKFHGLQQYITIYNNI